MSQTLLRQIIVEGVECSRILDLRVEEEAGKHGVCRLTAEVDKPLAAAKLLALGEQNVTLKTPEKNIFFCGRASRIAQEETDGRCRLKLWLSTLSCQLDGTKKSRTFQKSTKTLKEVLSDVAKDCGVSGADIRGGKGESDKIATMLYQERQTDWEFLHRLAESRGELLFADAKTNKVRIGVGVVPFTGGATGVVTREAGRRVLLGLAEGIKQNIDNKARSTYFTETDIVTENLCLGVGYGFSYDGKSQVVKRSQIVTEGSTLVNYVTLMPQEGCRPAAKSVLKEAYHGKYLAGKVLEAQGKDKQNKNQDNCIQVQFDCDKSQNKNDALWIPYMNVVNNYMYAMPDEGDRVAVYWEEDGKILAIGSLRAKEQAKDDWKPEERSFLSEDELLEFKKDELALVAGKKAGDVFLRETKDKGIFLQAKKDVIMTGNGDITLKSKSGKTEVQSGGTLLLKNGDSSIEVSKGKIKTSKLNTVGFVPGIGMGDGSPAAIAPGSVNNRGATIKAEHGAKDRKRIKGGGNSTNDNKRISRAG